MLIICCMHVHVLIYDMEMYTKEFYSVNFGVSEFASVDVTQPSPKPVKVVSYFCCVCVCVCVCSGMLV